MPRTPFAAQPRVALPGSNKPTFPGGQPQGPASARARVSVSVIVKRKQPLRPETIYGGEHLSRAQYRAAHGADPAAVKAVRDFATEFSLTARPPEPGRRDVVVTGSISALQKAFGITLTQHADVDGNTYRVREGEIQLPEELLPYVEAVLGLDDRPQAQPHFRVAKPNAVNNSFTPPEVAQLYSFPQNVSAKGQTIALIELGGGFRPADITAYFQTLNLPAPSVVAVSVDKGKNKPGNANGADGEVMLDIEVAASTANGAKIAVYFAPNTDQGFVDAISSAVHDTKNNPSVISISWGGPESSWTEQARNTLDQACQSAAALGITITVASGDNGSSDGETDGQNHVDFPASSPHVLACGGTKLVAANGSITSEVVWNETASKEGATGGGISTAFPQPTWQSGIAATKSGRGVPDVSGDADPTTGYQVRVDGQNMVIGGTSAVAPLWAGLIALCNAQNKSNAGLIQPKLYGHENAFHDITQGNNGAYKAAKGWDACTGLGTPIGTAIAQLLAPAKSTKKPTKSKGVKTS